MDECCLVNLILDIADVQEYDYRQSVSPPRSCTQAQHKLAVEGGNGLGESPARRTMALIYDNMPEVLPDLPGNGVDAVDDANGDLLADFLFTAPDDTDLGLRYTQKLFYHSSPLRQQFLGVYYDQCGLPACCNQVAGHNGFS